MSSPRVSIRIDPALQRKLTELARRTGRSESEVLREALRRHVKRRAGKGSCYELARRAGMIGAAKGLPSDLSTGRKHLEGLGE